MSAIGTDADAGDALIRLEGLERSFPGRDGVVHALRGVDLSIRAGEIFGIIGRSGAGKSTLVRCINLLERPTAGRVIFEGEDLRLLPERLLREKRRSMGMIFQQFNLLMQRTAEENVLFPMELAGTPKDEARRRAAELLELVGLKERMRMHPVQLSGGQKQRVAIARALAGRPRVLLCDEATSALDPETTDSILELLRDINRDMGITAVIVTHEMAVIERICHRVAILSRGVVAECGPVSDVFFHPRTEIARRLALPEALQKLEHRGLYRLIFNGRASSDPIVAGMVLHCGMPVNILYADTRDIDGTAYGQMVLQPPDDPEAIRRMLEYARANGVEMEEMSHD